MDPISAAIKWADASINGGAGYFLTIEMASGETYSCDVYNVSEDQPQLRCVHTYKPIFINYATVSAVAINWL